MTELEQKIYDTAIKELPEIRERLANFEYTTRYVTVAFYTGCICNELLYDSELNAFTKITYPKGKGELLIGGKGGGLFSDVEDCEMDVFIPLGD